MTNSGQTNRLKTLNEKDDRDNYMTAQEALEYGTDAIMESSKETVNEWRLKNTFQNKRFGRYSFYRQLFLEY